MSAFKITVPKNSRILVNIDSEVTLGLLIAESEFFPSELKIPIASVFKINPKDINKFLSVNLGDNIKQYDQIAFKKGGFLKKKKFICSPVDGKLISIDDTRGDIILGYERSEFKLISPGFGKVLEINEGSIEIDFVGKDLELEEGSGDVTFGEIDIISSFDEEVDHLLIDNSHKEKILVGGIWGKIDIAKAKALGISGVLGKQILSDFIKESRDLITDKNLLFNLGFSIGILSDKNFSYLKNHNKKKLIIDGDKKILCLLK